MKKIAQEELNKVLRLHKNFLQGKNDGERADLSNTDLSSADLSKANMEYAKITLTEENIEVLKQL